ncbi:MAG: family 10 glycosylhydrolase [Candidatus Cloacimonetes bacterium]|nr:family 10 glycosylhydrolase [Candidatus Cloacimonadota bacterium]
MPSRNSLNFECLYGRNISEHNFKKLRRHLIFYFLFIIFTVNLQAQIKALWVTPWDMNDKDRVLNVIDYAIEWGITDLLVEVRYRGDALYVPNRLYRDFPNNEPISYLLNSNPNFDALETFIHYSRGSNIRIHAWVTVNVITTRRFDTIQPNHLYLTHPQWLTYHSSGRRIRHDQFEGAFIDPGIPEVKQYIVNIFSDIVQNYEIDGLHLDYIRYPHPDYGHNRVSVDRYNSLRNILSLNSFQRWKELQIKEQVQMIGESIKNINPNIIYTAAVFANISDARNSYAQNWHDWLEEGLLDYAYIMAYQTRNSGFEQIVTNIPERFRNQIVVGIRAWSEDGTYMVQGIIDKINLTPSSYAGISFFSFGGIIEGVYQSAVTSYIVNNPINITRSTRPHQWLETRVNHEQEIILEIINNHNVSGHWSLIDLSENTVAEGRLSNYDNVVLIPRTYMDRRYLVLRYDVNNESFMILIDLLH